MSRLPIPGSDNGTWGKILNDFLEVAHNEDGTLKSGSGGFYTKPSGGIPKTDLASDVQNALFDATNFSTYQLKIDYNSTPNPVYVGEAIRGAATSASGWTVMKVSYDGSNNPTVLQTADGTWDGRGALTYS